MRLTFAACALALVFLAGGRALAQAPGEKQLSGKVTAVSNTSLTIEAGSGAAKSSKTFVLDDKTSVIARGATRATKGQERGAATTLIGTGDSVTVSYAETGSTMHATQVRVTQKAKKS